MKSNLFIFLILILFSSCKIKEIEIGKFKNYKLAHIEENKANIEFSVPVKNLNTFGFTISDIRLNLSLNDKEIGTVKKKNKIRIPANSQNTYPILVEIKINKAIGSISSLTAGLLKNNVGIKAKGYIKVRKFIFTKKFPVDQQEIIKIF